MVAWMEGSCQEKVETDIFNVTLATMDDKSVDNLGNLFKRPGLEYDFLYGGVLPGESRHLAWEKINPKYLTCIYRN